VAAEKQEVSNHQKHKESPVKVTNPSSYTKNYFAPLRDLEMKETKEGNSKEDETSNLLLNGKERRPPIIITYTINLLKFQAELNVISKGSFELRSGRNGARIITKDMVDYLAIKKHLEEKKICFYTFFPKSMKPIKVVIRQLPGNTPAEDIAKELQGIGFDIISLRQLISRKPQAPINLTLFLVTLPRNDKSPEIFQLSSLSHAILKVEAYRAQTGLNQCYNCQQFGHI
jgi:hypothetical protein